MAQSLLLESYRDGVGLAPLVDCPHVGRGVVDLTHQAWKSNLRVRHIADIASPRIKTVALCTDGANPYFFKVVNGNDEKHRRGAFNPQHLGPQLSAQLEARSPRNFIGYLATLMFAEGHVDETDDKTLIVATLPEKATAMFPDDGMTPEAFLKRLDALLDDPAGRLAAPAGHLVELLHQPRCASSWTSG